MSEKYSNVEEWVKSPSTFHPFPKACERIPWEEISSEVAERFVAQGEQYLNYHYPTLPAVYYMDFVRTGDRSRYSALQHNVKTALGSLVVAECIEGKNRFLDDIVNGIWSICEQSSWVAPAHNHQMPGNDNLALPNVERPYIDLSASETGALLAWVLYVCTEL